jgi:hypothetical protein
LDSHKRTKQFNENSPAGLRFGASAHSALSGSVCEVELLGSVEEKGACWCQQLWDRTRRLCVIDSLEYALSGRNIFLGAELSVADSGEGGGEAAGGRGVSEAPIIGWCNVKQRTTNQRNSIRPTSRIWIGGIRVFCRIQNRLRGWFAWKPFEAVSRPENVFRESRSNWMHRSTAVVRRELWALLDKGQLLSSQIRLGAFAGRKNIPRHLLIALQRHEFHGK